jgi:hypothetical protein
METTTSPPSRQTPFQRDLEELNGRHERRMAAIRSLTGLDRETIEQLCEEERQRFKASLLTRTRAGARRTLFNWLAFACALLLGFAAGRSVADAAGAVSPESSAQPITKLPNKELAWVVFAMVLLAFFAFVAILSLIRLGQWGAGILAKVESRPSIWTATAITVCGLLCLLSVVALQWHESSVSASISASLPSLEMPGSPKGMPNAGVVSVRARTSLMMPVTTVGVLLAGLVLMGVGIWGSIPPGPAPVSQTATMRESGKVSEQAIQAERGAAADRGRDAGSSE